MTPAARERRQVQAPMWMLSAAAWVLLAIAPGGTGLSTHCALGVSGAGMQPAGFSALLAANPPSSLAMGWALMLAAMMSPLLIAPVRHLRERSFTRRRVRAIALFAAGYTAIWMPVGGLMLALALAVRLAAAESSVPLVAAALVALVWQFSPVKQRCLNRCHNHGELAAFGRAADRDALRFGLAHGVWCVGSCWALMLLPLLVSGGHIAAMAAATLWLLAERLDSAMPPRWRLRVPGKAARIAAAQARMLLLHG